MSTPTFHVMADRSTLSFRVQSVDLTDLTSRPITAGGATAVRTTTRDIQSRDLTALARTEGPLLTAFRAAARRKVELDAAAMGSQRVWDITSQSRVNQRVEPRTASTSLSRALSELVHRLRALERRVTSAAGERRTSSRRCTQAKGGNVVMQHTTPHQAHHVPPVRTYTVTFMVMCLLSLAACDDSIATVQGGVLELQPDVLIGEGFASSPLCTEEQEWTKKEAANGATTVEFRCRAALYDILTPVGNDSASCRSLVERFRKDPAQCEGELQNRLTALSDSGAFLIVRFSIDALNGDQFRLSGSAIEDWQGKRCHGSSALDPSFVKIQWLPYVLVNGSVVESLKEMAFGGFLGSYIEMSGEDIVRMCLGIDRLTSPSTM